MDPRELGPKAAELAYALVHTSTGDLGEPTPTANTPCINETTTKTWTDTTVTPSHGEREDSHTPVHVILLVLAVTVVLLELAILFTWGHTRRHYEA